MGGVHFVVLSLFSVALGMGNTGEPVMFYRQMSPFDMRPLHQPVQLQPISRNVQYDYRMVPQEQTVSQDRLQPIIHNNNPQLIETATDSLNKELSDLQRAAEAPRPTAKSGYEYPHSQPGYGYTAPASSYSPAPSPPSYAPPHHDPTTKFSIIKPDLTSLLKPVTTKVATKVSGLIGLVLSLLTGSAPDDLEMKGFKDIVINGIVKPLLIAKGGIKSLISKLTIPVISLLLINLEVLVTVWWLWEECPEPVKPDYSKPTYPANYNPY